ncbi:MULTISPECIES: hypothetical protein [Rhodococcus]|uniref:hypothetical protein n=1 Tax=Rhodococcus TaxID=1827 RepID=UPI00197F61BB|nr:MULTISPECIES: hypothetical protein [Rhodococcus]QSE78021.1 hypothetical protein JWS14_01965 [Rhodococcus koreensis]
MIKQVVTTVNMTPVAEAVAIPFVAQFLDEKRNFVPTPPCPHRPRQCSTSLSG